MKRGGAHFALYLLSYSAVVVTASDKLMFLLHKKQQHHCHEQLSNNIVRRRCLLHCPNKQVRSVPQKLLHGVLMLTAIVCSKHTIQRRGAPMGLADSLFD